ncbi:uncharacterized protein LOC114536772 [Dendronephthya gigantea]|uniref:uncharacterized protein LOC114536772 n=1 Tax=Dendronephthya gigantea TaxID=151771 RepID=UPI0010698F40|nr:uncharacterized protein LOC114536772 [Dendronephthya gigantea]
MNCAFVLMFVVLVPGAISSVAVEYNFEGSIPSEISPKTNLQITTSRFKKGSKSLKWQWSAAQKLTWDLSAKNVQIKRNAGIQIWVHNSEALANKCLSICVRQLQDSSEKNFCFPFSLNFKGWRGAWVSYSEFFGCSTTSSASVRGQQNYVGKVKQFTITAPSGVTSSKTLHIDFLRFLDKLPTGTRDLIVPPLTYVESNQNYCTSCSKIFSGLTQEDALLRHRRKSFWHQIYRWSLQPAYPSLPSTVDSSKMTAITEITRRLINWYASDTHAFTTIPHSVSTTDSFLKHRWDSLVKYFDDARVQYQKLLKGGSTTPNSGLFSRNDKSKARGGIEEFSFVHHRVLLPLTLEFHLKSRTVEVEHVACEFAKKYNCDSGNTLADADVEAITGKDASLKASFRASYSRSFDSTSNDMAPKCSTVKKACVEHVKGALESISNLRKTKIIGLMNYLKDQGLSKGSALGSMDHELLQMTGFLHSMFLMRKHLASDMVETMKWYVEFGEVYQETFEFKGSTADRIRSAMLYRLMAVLAMPESNKEEKTKKIRDMDAFKRWVENALSVTEGLSGLVKPDYTVFHHKTFYASAYGPQALHTVALISSLLEETAFELSSQIKLNIIDSLKVLRISAVLYSTPSSIGARFPRYDQAILAEMVPAYCYMATKSPSKDYLANGDPNFNSDLAEVRMCLRLYQPVPGSCTGELNERLCQGKASRIYYLNTLGSLEIIERVKRLAATYKIGPRKWFYKAEESPIGHWAKQFGSFSVHRRDDWAVSMKGFDKFVWDFESGKDNIYGMYGSHGAMLIANSEAALSSKNIDKGWDWRNSWYNPADNAMAGGLFLEGSKGKRQSRNGVFGMDFKQPTYIGEKSSPFKTVDFRFKKSVFFYDDLIVSLGSNIQHNGQNYEVHTTLFQDLMPSTSSSSSSTSSSNIFSCNNNGLSTKTSWSNIELAILVDVNGNRYYVPNPDSQGLVLHRNQRQDSYKANRNPPEATNGMYCTAWFNHGRNPSGAKSKYEYAVQVNAEPSSGTKKAQLVPSNRYRVIKKSAKTHVVEFKEHNGRGLVYGYVVFPISPSKAVRVGKSGPIKSVLQQSIMMTEETTSPKRLYISVKSPQLKLEQIDQSPSWCKGGKTNPSRNGDVDETLLYCSKSADQSVHINLRKPNQWSRLLSLYVGGKNKTGSKSDYLERAEAPNHSLLKFNKLQNGAETEVAFQ